MSNALPYNNYHIIFNLLSEGQVIIQRHCLEIIGRACGISGGLLCGSFGSCLRAAVGIRTRRLIIAAAIGAGSVTALAGEADVISDYLDRGTVLTVLRLILTGLELAVDRDQRAFGEIAAYEFRRAAPRDNIKEICLTLFARFHIAAVYSDTERSNGNAGVGCL